VARDIDITVPPELLWSYRAGYRPPLTGSDALVRGQFFVNVIDGVICHSRDGGAYATVELGGGKPGPEGPAGPAGPQGPSGPQGVQGATGPAGPTGATGPQGIQGERGPTGPTGDAGPAGPRGPAGEAGATGPKGDAGAAGAQGLKGDTGATGAPGPKGDPGATGAQGATGATGPAGPTGAQGPKGDTGTQGATGPAGATGAQGPVGATGPQGNPTTVNGKSGSSITLLGTDIQMSGVEPATVRDAINGRVLADASGKAPASRVSIGSMAENLVVNGDMEEVSGGQCVGWVIADSAGTVSLSQYTAAPFSGSTALLLDRGSNAANANRVEAFNTNSFMGVSGSAAYEASCFTYGADQASAVGFYFRFYWYDKDSVYLNIFSDAFSNAPIPANWTQRNSQIISPSSARKARVSVMNGQNSTTRYLAVDAVSLRRATGGTALEDGAVLPGKFYAPTRGQFFRALENSGAGRVALVRDAVPSDAGDPDNIAFNHTTFVTTTGRLAQLVKGAVPLTDAAFSSIIANARTVAE